jgi:hypothetical protein
MDEITVTINPEIMKIAANHPICFLILYIMVWPVMMVSLLIAIKSMSVKKHERNNAHVNDIPYLAPETTIEVTLPVPTTYPTMNNPGMIDSMNALSFPLLCIKNQVINIT